MAEIKIQVQTENPKVEVKSNRRLASGANNLIVPDIKLLATGSSGTRGEKGEPGTLSDSDRNAIDLNTAKVGITTQQSAAIIANTAKVGITTEQANAIITNTSKVGITTEQANAISANTSKVGITTSQASAIVANTAKNSYPSSDSTKLAGIETGAKVNVQADFNETDSNSDAFIKNKPTDTNTTYTVSCVDGDNADEEKIRLTDSSGTNDDIVLEAGTGLSIARSGDKITFTNTVTDTDTVLTTEQVQDIVGAMFTSNTETRISATYQDDDGTIDLVVDDMTADTNTNVGNTDLTLSGSRSINTGDNTFQIKNGSTVYLEFDDSGITAFVASGDLDIGAHQIRASKFQSDVATGTAPLTVASTSAVANLQAATATTLHTARNIGGVSFDGSSNIDLPGVNTTGNQNTTGNADTATIASSAQRITGVADEDVNILSDGEVIIKLDSDNDETNQKLKVVNNADTEVASINEDGTFYLTGSITNLGSDNDLEIQSDGNMTFVIDRDNDETSQSFSFKNFNVEVANLDESGNLQIDGDLTVSGSGTTSIGGTLSCADLDITGTSNALTVNPQTGNVAINCISTDADCLVRLQDDSTTATNVIAFAASGDDSIVRNDEGNFKVKMANNATDTLNLDQSGNLTVTGIITGKQREIYSQSFTDDLGTTKHFIPWKDINEQTTI